MERDAGVVDSITKIHRRSKSASGKSIDVARTTTSFYCTQKNFNEFKNPRISLENDVKQLQMHLRQEKSVRAMLEREIGRASSTLSPGHKHFSTQTRELISEIELLEEEIAKREQHVLSLYRTIFEQCSTSAPSSAKSSEIVSPTHPKSIIRKQPSIISAAFCSSKKFPLRKLNVLASIKESGTSRSFSGTIKKFPNVRRNGLDRTLKEHLYQCPSKLSEQMVRCMAAIYCWIRSNEHTEPNRTNFSFLSRSSTNEFSSSSVVEVYSISVDRNHFSSASCAISNYRLLVEQLERVDVERLESNVKLAFWINVYNSLVMHAYLTCGVLHSSLRRISLFHKAVYNVGGHTINASSIENSILCIRTPRNGSWFETILSTAMRKKYCEEKNLLTSNIGFLTSQPLALFALCNGAASDPMLRVYTAKNVTEELEKAKKQFLQTNVVVKKSRKIYLPRILERYAKEASLSYEEMLTWVTGNVDDKLNESIKKCLGSNNRKKASQVVEWIPYNTRFRYVIEKNLAESPSWV